MAVRVAHFLDKLFYGGGQRHVQLLAKHLRQYGFDSVIVSTNRHEFAREFESDGIPFRQVGCLSLNSILSVLRSHRIDIIHVHGTRFSISLRLLRPVLGVPVVLTLHGNHARKYALLPGSKWRAAAWARRSLDRFLNRYLDMLICVSEEDLRLLTESGQANPGKSTVIHNGLPVESYAPPATVGRALRKSPTRGRYVVTCVARFAYAKGHRYLLEAIPEVTAAIPGTEFLLIGDGELMEKIRTTAYKVMALSPETVQFLGVQPDVRAYLWDSDLFVLPSLWEGMPLALIEAMAAGVPQVATNVCGNREVVAAGVTGELVEPADGPALASTIIKLLRDHQLRRRYAENSLARARERFGVEKMVESTRQTYIRVLDSMGR